MEVGSLILFFGRKNFQFAAEISTNKPSHTSAPIPPVGRLPPDLFFPYSTKLITMPSVEKVAQVD
jgi:hypothetical protein